MSLKAVGVVGRAAQKLIPTLGAETWWLEPSLLLSKVCISMKLETGARSKDHSGTWMLGSVLIPRLNSIPKPFTYSLLSFHVHVSSHMLLMLAWASSLFTILCEFLFLFQKWSGNHLFQRAYHNLPVQMPSFSNLLAPPRIPKNLKLIFFLSYNGVQFYNVVLCY